ncbi:outer membrane beta-barrel protein [Tenacibaculum sp. TC6]|uniref:outer membrane beta-barrel protein n=1 Tax=Tenacibaculum sp. TC6 TaxID=3423223 RepID=UPI003D36739E
MMKRSILLIAMILVAVSANAQFYVSASGGYSIPSAGVRFGTETTMNGIKNTYGSYGEGIHTQLRGGYYFNKSFGVEVGLGYLYGSDQNIAYVELPNQPFVDVKARGRAYGASASVVYKFTNNVYGRIGALIKVGGKTEAIGILRDIKIPANTFPGVPVETTLDVDFVHDYKGRLPLGAIAAIGYKYDVAKNVSLFVEAEYMGVSVTRDSSTMKEFSAVIRENGATLNVDQVREIMKAGGSPLTPVFNNHVEYVDELPLGADQTGSKQLSQKVPYSSFGVNFGITYTFGK